MSFWQRLNTRRNSTYLVLVVAAVFVLIILFNSLSRTTSAYEARLLQAREQRDLTMKNSTESPISREDKTTFEGLTYFPVDAKYLVTAELVPAERPDTIRMLLSNSRGQYTQMVRLGTLEFTMTKRPWTLTAFRELTPEAQGQLFIPFTDLTTGVQTYGGGRYLNIPDQVPYQLDFNRAYHPDCFYNDSYACPIPPRENHLELEVLAGERMPPKTEG